MKVSIYCLWLDFNWLTSLTCNNFLACVTFDDLIWSRVIWTFDGQVQMNFCFFSIKFSTCFCLYALKLINLVWTILYGTSDSTSYNQLVINFSKTCFWAWTCFGIFPIQSWIVVDDLCSIGVRNDAFDHRSRKE